MKGSTPTAADLTVGCRRCGRRVILAPEIRKALAALGVGEKHEVLCDSCATELGVGGDPYSVNAGYLYRRFCGFAVKLWPIGTFHL